MAWAGLCHEKSWHSEGIAGTQKLILDYPRQALEFFAQAEAQGIDDSARITPIRQEQLKERLGVSRTPIIPSDGKRIFPTHL
ncbi:hypothetical protein [Thauera butanivorans]|uniref:hypothetical protein n=1 Tax=Thauera butanivorans TaxID=86174 RepID=UPI0008397092|nr:hypothetical protein [Thauera butanivorans]